MRLSPRDQSFLSFLQREFPKRDPKLDENILWARRYVTGFNAADPADVSVNWLVQQQNAEEKIGADRAFFINRGYNALVEILMERLQKLKVPIHLSCVAKDVPWSQGRVEVTGSAKQQNFRFEAARVLTTVPLGVLLANHREKGAIRFDPPLPPAKTKALEKLAMGHALRVTLQFKERFWKDIRPATNKSKTLANLSFLFSEEEWFSTWWTKSPARLPVITGWSAFQSAESLSGHGRRFVINEAVATLGRLLQTPKKEVSSLLASAHFHDWRNDPFSRGAYSYVKVGGMSAPGILARPVQQTLFFAGEATDSSQTGTVHGAIASGKRAASEIIKLA
jgi:monoamine oxidase